MTGPDLVAAAAHALGLIPDGGVVGLGTGRAAATFTHALGEWVRAGFRVRAVPTSEAAERLAFALGIPVASLDDVDSIDVAVDGADEVDPAGNLIKGYGGALVREKVVAAVASRVVILVGPEKLVPVLGTRGVLPVEVIPFAVSPCTRRLAALGCKARKRAGYISDNGNPVLDCEISPLPSPGNLDAAIRAIPGVVGTGLFLGLNPTVLVGDPNGGVIVRGPMPH